MDTNTENPTPWLRQPGETDCDFARFERFCLMGPVHRSVNAVWIAEQTEAGKPIPDSRNAPGRFYEHARKWDWESRAMAWDAHQCELASAALAESHRLLQESALKGVRTVFELLENTEPEWLHLQAANLLVRESHRAAEKSAASLHGLPPRAHHRGH